MRYLEVLEAAAERQLCRSSERAKRARERLAAADRKRSEAGQKYRDQLDAARTAAEQARAEIRKATVGEEIGCADIALSESGRSYALRDRHGVLLGWIEAVGRLLQAKDRGGTIIGWYDPGRNQTRDRTGAIIGTGDFLSALLVCKRNR